MRRMERACLIKGMTIPELCESARVRAWRLHRQQAAPRVGWPPGVDGEKFVRSYIKEITK